MNKIKIYIVYLLFFLVAVPVLFAQAQKGKNTVTFFVEEMECEHCKSKVEKNIAFEKGVTDLKCDLEQKTVEVTYKTDKTSPEKLIKGFKKIKMTAVPVDSLRNNHIIVEESKQPIL